MRRIGVIVNPIAGMGGRVGLKGTDGAATLARARELGARPVSAERAARALRELPDGIELLAAPGAMGATSCAAAGRPCATLDLSATGAEATRAAARAMQAAGVELLLFAGGDGTARDVLAALGTALPILGIPTGVKMQSAVFATSPAAAGRVAAAFLRDGLLREAEVMDLDEDALREGRVSPRLHGFAKVPRESRLMQACKAGASVPDEAALDALARRLVGQMRQGRLYLLGCGTTTRRIKQALGFDGTLMGVDVALDRRLLAADVSEAQLLRLLDEAPATAIIGVTGGQGFLLGRGNQQLSPAVLRRLGRENIMVVAGAQKLALLDPACLHVDTGEPALDAALAGYIAVHTAPGRTAMLRIAA
ncbi:ATP-NAD kinase family protein [Falsiroseomonas sp. E2-1-a20]|uniref:ATP-NAD kinase family protein n=1 Tax=Falsiroseomonas sp. E2-1-a20 TaxID=3239300 RepID=UPI003F37B18E